MHFANVAFFLLLIVYIMYVYGSFFILFISFLGVLSMFLTISQAGLHFLRFTMVVSFNFCQDGLMNICYILQDFTVVSSYMSLDIKVRCCFLIVPRLTWKQVWVEWCNGVLKMISSFNDCEQQTLYYIKKLFSDPNADFLCLQQEVLESSLNISPNKGHYSLTLLFP